jgi:hypothetical protein
MGELSHRDQLLAQIELYRETLADLEDELRQLDNPAPQYKRPKLVVLRGGLAVFLGPFAVMADRVRDHLTATTAATAAAVSIVTGGTLMVAELPKPAEASQPAGSVHQPVDVQAPILLGSGWVSPPRSTPQARAGTPTPTSTPTPVPTLLVGDDAVIVDPTVTPLPLVTAEPEPTVTPTLSPRPTGAPLTQSKAVAYCLDLLGIPPTGLPACVTGLLNGG